MQLPNMKTLPNGLRVLSVPFKGIDSATVTIRGLAGSNFEDPNEVGIAHLLEHAVFDGTQKYPSNEQIESLVENAGGYNNARTSKNTVEYYVKLLKEDVEIGFDLLSELTVNPLLRGSTIKKEREIVRQEAIRSFTDPVNKFFKERFKSFFPQQRVSYPVIGELNNIRNIRTSNVQGFHKNNYTAENFVLGVCGNFSDGEIFELADKYFSQMPSGIKKQRPNWLKNEEKEYFVKRSKEVNQATMKISYFAPVFDDDDMYPTRYLASVLGESFLSRLFFRLRTQLGYAYAVSCPYETNYDYGLFGIYIQFSENNFEKVVKAIQEEITKITTELITEEEFAREKKQNTTGYVFYFERPSNRLSFYTGMAVKDWYPGLNHEMMLAKYEKVTREDVLRVAQSIFSSNPKIGVLSRNLTKAQVQKAL